MFLLTYAHASGKAIRYIFIHDCFEYCSLELFLRKNLRGQTSFPIKCYQKECGLRAILVSSC